MRGPEDNIVVHLKTLSQLSLDWERIEKEDPVWHRVSAMYNLADPEQKREALRAYLAFYLQRERVLRDMPTTNGPGEVMEFELEVFFGSGSRESGS